MPTGTSFTQFENPPQIVEEVTEGTTPTASPVFVAIGAVKSLSIKRDGNFEDIGQLGAEELIALIQGLQTYETQVKLSVLNTTFVKRLVNDVNWVTPTGTISAPFSMLVGVRLSGTINYILFKGSRVKDGSYTREAGKADEWTVTITHMNITVPATTHGLTTPTIVGPISGAVHSYLSGGALSISWNATGINAKKITINFNRNTKEEHIVGQIDPLFTLPHAKLISFEATVIWTNNTLESDHYAGTARTLSVVVETSVSTLTITSAKITSHKKDANAGESNAVIEDISGRALDCSIT